jgi:curved DNA-binding protein CbpA
VLRVDPTATHEEIKAAFHGLARIHHPDKQPTQRNAAMEGHDDGSDATTSLLTSSLPFPIIQTAWETLRDADKRQQYDHELLQQQLTSKKSDNAAIAVSRDDLQEAIDEDTGETLFVHECRCGELLEIDDDDREILLDCPGCCFVYRFNVKT